MSDWISKLIKNGKTIAVLQSSGKWKSDDEDLQLYLQTRFNPDRTSGVGVVLPYGHLQSSLAGIQLKAEVKFAETFEPLPPELIS